MKFLQIVIIIILLRSVAHHAVALSTHAQFSQRDSHALLNQNGSDHECPSVWSEYNQVTHDCQCIQHISLLDCKGENVYASTRHILTYNSNKEIISAVRIRYIKHLEGYNLTMIKDGTIYYGGREGPFQTSNFSDLRSNDMLHPVQSASGLGILWRMWPSRVCIQSDKVYGQGKHS